MQNAPNTTAGPFGGVLMAYGTVVTAAVRRNDEGIAEDLLRGGA